MGISQSPKIVSEGLIFQMDARNPRSYKGPVITNQFAVPTPNSSNNVTFAVQGTGTFKRVFEGIYGGYTIKADDVVYRYDLGTAGCHYHGNDATITSGHYATWQFDYYIDKNIANFPTTNYLANFENLGAGISGSVTVASPTIGAASNWRSVRYTIGPATATGTLRALLYPGACSSSYLASAGYILYRNPAVWYTPYVPTANLPFVAGSRSNTQALLDPVGQNTITAVGSLLEFSDNKITIPNTNYAYLQVTPSTNFNMGTQDFTISVWVKQLDTGYNIITEARDSSTLQGYLFILNYPSAGRVSMFINPSTGQAIYSTTASTLPSNVIQNITAVVKRSNATVEIYLNGELYDTITGIQSATISGSGDMYRIGYDRGGSSSNIEIYAYMHYSKALTQEEITQNFNALRGRYGI